MQAVPDGTGLVGREGSRAVLSNEPVSTSFPSGENVTAATEPVYLDQQHLDTTTPTGKLLFQVTGAVSEFERNMIRQRVNAGLCCHQG
jgi:hypothetical protein